MDFKNKLGVVCLSLVMLFALASFAQVNANNLVNVNVSNIKADIAKNINVDVSQIPVTVQVPVGVAANVCDVSANVLAEQAKNGGAQCDAKNTSTALDQTVQRQIGGQQAGGQQSK